MVFSFKIALKTGARLIYSCFPRLSGGGGVVGEAGVPSGLQKDAHLHRLTTQRLLTVLSKVLKHGVS